MLAFGQKKKSLTIFSDPQVLGGGCLNLEIGGFLRNQPGRHFGGAYLDLSNDQDIRL